MGYEKEAPDDFSEEFKKEISKSLRKSGIKVIKAISAQMFLEHKWEFLGIFFWEIKILN